MKRPTNGQRGFTLIELVMAVAAATIILAAASYGILHTFNLNTRNTNYMTAVREAQNAGYWVSRDGEMANNVIASSSLPNVLSLTWLNSDNINQPLSCNYTLENPVTVATTTGTSTTYTLWRSYFDGTETTKNMVAQYIYFNSLDLTKTNFGYDATARKLTFTVTAAVTTRKITGTEQRVYQVALRPGAGGP